MLTRSLWKSPAVYFARHYTEMIVAMFAGMFVFGMPLAVALGLVGVEVSDWRTDAPELFLLAMAFSMSVPMGAWMRYRRHGWPPVWEMVGAMFVPSLVAIGLLWAGTVNDMETLLVVQHVGMFPAMLAVMLLRIPEYTGHRAHAHA